MLSSLSSNYYYLLSVSLSLDGKTMGLTNEAVHIYPELTSTFTREFSAEHFTEPGDPPEQGSLGVTIGFGVEAIPVGDTAIDLTASVTLSVPDDAGFTNIKWYVDEGTTAVSETASCTLDPENYSAGTHILVVSASKNGRLYSEIVEFTVAAEGGGEVTPENLATYLAALPDGTPTEPNVVKLASFDVTSDTWGTTVKDALTANSTKYISLDLSACTSGTTKTITGAVYNPSGNAFNVILYGMDHIVGIILPDDLEIIGNNALYYANGLRSVTLPDSITSIGNSAFGYALLSEITIPAEVTTIGTTTFIGCTDLVTVTFEGSVVVMNDNSFLNILKTVYESYNSSERIGTYIKTSTSWEKQND
jgi:hypothetical protein